MKNEFRVTKELYMLWGKENMRRGLQKKFRIIWSFMAGIMLLFIVLAGLFLSGGLRKYMLIYGIVLLVYCIYRAFFRNMVLTNSQYKRNAQIFGGENWVRTIEFGEDDIICTEGGVTVRTPYSEIAGMRDSGSNIWLDTKKNMVIRLYKDKFVGGDFEKFKKFISAKIGE